MLIHFRSSSSRCMVLLLVAGLVATGCNLSAGHEAIDRDPTSVTWGPPRFTDITRTAGISTDHMRTWGSVVFDYDLDGDADILIGRHIQRAQFYLNRGDDFARKHFSALKGPPRLGRYYDRHSCGWGEANHDGRPDLYCVSGAQKGQGTGPNQLLINTGDNLVDRSVRFGVANRRGRGRSLNWLHANRDRALDLFVGNQVRSGYPNLLLRRGRDRFKRVAAGVGTQINVTSSIWADWDRDRDPDLLVLGRGTHGALAYRNVRSRFKRVSLNGITGRVWLSGSFGDFNGDGWVDLVMVAKSELRIFANNRGKFRPVYRLGLSEGRTAEWLDVENDGDLDLFVVRGRASGRNKRDFFLIRRGGTFRYQGGGSFGGGAGGDGDSVSTGDLNRDGRVDLVVTNGYGRTRGRTALLQNRTPAGNWLELHLRGGDKNPSGFGARVRVRAGSRILHRHVTDGVGFQGQSEATVHLGLGSRTRARVRVSWPNGQKDCLFRRANQVIVVNRGSRPCG
jgi:ASPIC and UnbV/FG-GAP-like repeat/FG-GAP repeat